MRGQRTVCLRKEDLMDIKEIIREKTRENFYEFYLSLGYDERTAAVLALYTYGNGRGRRLTLDELFEALC